MLHEGIAQEIPGFCIEHDFQYPSYKSNMLTCSLPEVPAATCHYYCKNITVYLCTQFAQHIYVTKFHTCDPSTCNQI